MNLGAQYGFSADRQGALRRNSAVSPDYLTEFVLLADVAVRAKQKVQWDGPNMKATNVPAAQAFVQETYRQGWDLAKV
ncbi:MAG: hypothetical protein IMZ44_20270 [Planctomycetes bacterium]|nr:hypothetical protein [Planctomycetota bacterium]